jgi:23S rRNA pseudouridine1911/1915/1917 synthase
MASLGHPVVGDTLYGAPAQIHLAPATGRAHTPRRKVAEAGAPAQPTLQLERNFLHAAELALAHPITGRALAFAAPLPHELELFVKQLTTELITQPPDSPAKTGAVRKRIQ